MSEATPPDLLAELERRNLLAELDRRDRLAAAFGRMSEWERSRLTRFALRLLNHDAKALRLAELQEAGKITRRELLARM